jgi:hypothetical protein
MKGNSSFAANWNFRKMGVTKLDHTDWRSVIVLLGYYEHISNRKKTLSACLADKPIHWHYTQNNNG